MIKFDLKGALQAYEAKTGLRLTYKEVSTLTGISVDTLKSIATRDDYNATLKMIGVIGLAINLDPTQFLTWKNI